MSASLHLDERDTQPSPSPSACSLAYLVSQYPTLSMTFVLREVLYLRRMNFHIDVASVNPPDRPRDRLTASEAAETEHTYYLKPHGIPGAFAAHGKTLLKHLPGYLRGAALALRLGGLDLKRLAMNLMYLTEALMVGVWMERNGQRHVHAHLGQQAATVGMYVRRVFNVGLSMTVHGPDEFYDAQGQYLAEKVAAADFVVCISFFARSQLMKFSPYEHWSKLVVSRLGVDPAVFEPRPAREPSDTFEILCVGRLTPSKGQHILIDTVGRLVAQGRRVRLRIIGAGPDASSLEKSATALRESGAVIFEGAVNQDRIRGFYSTADVFCLPSFAEGIPVVLMEAMAMEIPCVSTQIAGIPELIRNGVDGLLVAASDIDGLTDALARLMDDPALRERLGRSGRQRVLEHYNLQSNVEKLAAIFAERVRP
ncbi:MAG TPA: glycosyltransferase family 4 protein [Silvibacterium sp.]|nr:glycosyltransferase family 4 protein [Silvibacterium sp.]